MDVLLPIGKVLLAIFASASVAHELYSKWHRLGFFWLVWKRVKVRMLLEVIVVIIFTIIAVVSLAYYIPFMDWGWTKLLFKDGGNIVITPMMDASSSTNLYIRLLVPIFLLMLMASMPFLVHSEEKTFRKGYHEWKEIIKQSFKFGFIHMIVGVPLAAGLALSGVGLFYAYKYKKEYDRLEGFSCRKREKEAVIISTAYHTVFNTLCVGALLIIYS